METTLVMPGFKKKSVKHVVFDILCTEYPLTLTRLHDVITKNHTMKVSYQGIRFSINELVSEGIVSKVGKEYILSKEWIDNLDNFSEALKESYSERGRFKRFDLQTTQVTVNSLYEMADFLLYGLENNLFDVNNSKELYLQFVHLWFPYANKSKRNRLKKCFMQNNVYCLCQEKTLGDILLGKYFKTWNQHLKVGVPLNLQCDVWVHGDCVLQIYMPQSLRKQMKEANSFAGAMSFKIIDAFSDMTFSKNRIDIIITRNPDIANNIKTKILKYFR